MSFQDVRQTQDPQNRKYWGWSGLTSSSKCFILQGSKKGFLGEIGHTCWEIRVEMGEIHKIESVSRAATKKE